MQERTGVRPGLPGRCGCFENALVPFQTSSSTRRVSYVWRGMVLVVDRLQPGGSG